ncbi:Up-regulated during septation protein 1 domain-containing protein [Madurella fahalii]|uniref:Up-regulated during septation protein 1 domain-containing protein n=1 Tax=Madurella fahalii TaxID=1157608 RepID=A0ABQ0GMY5_9PEZI
MPAMWDRLRTAPHKQGGVPFDGDDRIGLGLNYGTRNAPRGYSYSIKGGPAPSRPPREFFESRYETAPPVQEPPPRNPNRITVRTSNFRPASSVYSQPSSPRAAPNYSANVATAYGYRYGGADEISPPSSPEPDAGGADRFLPGDVSPIDEDDQPTISQHAAPPGTDMSRSGGSGRAGTPESRQVAQGSPPNRGGASIPMMRRERRKQSDAATRDANSSQRGPAQQQSRNPPAREGARWDPLTGERTGSAMGRPSQVNPAESAQGLGITTQAWASPQNSPTAAPPSFGDRVRRIAKKAAAARDGNTDPAAGAFTSSRPGWRGASGRTAIVDPVHDTPEVAPLRIPEKSTKRSIKPAGSKPGLTLGGPLRRGQTPPTSPPLPETATRSGPREALRRILPSSQQAPATTHSQTPSDQSYPSPPLSGTSLAGDAPAAAARELAQDGLVSISALPSPTFNNNPSEPTIRRKSPPVHTNYQPQAQHQHLHQHQHQHQHQVSVSSVYSQSSEAPQPHPLHIPVTQVASSSPNDEPWVQPPSRFSITTYATSNTGTTREDGDDLVDEDQPPVPSLPADFQHHHHDGTNHQPSSDNSPVTSPIDQFMTSPFASTDPQQHTVHSHAHNPALARVAQAVDRPPSRASDVNKTLPPAPPEASAGEAQDRVGLLNAQLRALANRRININRSIQQMTELMPTDKLMNSSEVVRKREEEKKKVEALRLELSEVQREEYELGLKLHRAYKRLDREAEWEPTTLWVRRVTG